LASNGQVKVLDFGLARVVREGEASSGLTPHGVLLGTPDYVAPEQARDPGRADVRADVYSLGCTLYLLLTGQPPFENETVLAKLLAHQENTPPPLAGFRTDLPQGLPGVLERLMAKDPEERYATPEDAAEALAPFTGSAEVGMFVAAAPMPAGPLSQLPTLVQPRTEGPPPRPRRYPYGLATAFLVCASGGLYLVGRWIPGDPPPSAPVSSVAQATTAATHRRTVLSREELRTRALDWLKTNANAAPDSKGFRGMTADISRPLDRDLAAIFMIGKDLVKSNRPTILTARCGAFHVFELTEAEARNWPAGDNVLDVRVRGEKDRVRPVPAFELVEPRFDNANEFDADKGGLGSVVCRLTSPCPGPFTLRITLFDDAAITLQMTVPLGESIRTTGDRLFFRLTSFNSPKRRLKGPVVLFLELCAADGPNGREDTIIVSNSVAVVVNVSDAASP
jgi:hypothetical protein